MHLIMEETARLGGWGIDRSMKRILAVLMLCLLVPACALAEDCSGFTVLTKSGLAAGSYILKSGSYRLQEDIDLGGGTLRIPSGETVKLCLHGKQLSKASAVAIRIEGGGTLTLTNCKRSGGVSTNTVEYGHVYGVINAGTLELRGSASVSAQSTGTNNVRGIWNTGSLSLRDDASVSAKGEGADVCGVLNQDIFTMYSGTVTGKSGVENKGKGTFTMHDGTVTGTRYYGVTGGVFTMHGGLVQVTDRIGGCGVQDSRFTMNGGTVKGAACGVDVGGSFSISAGRIEASPGSAVSRKVTEEKSILPGSYKVDGAFSGPYVVVAKRPQEAVPELPQTGDASMLGAWMCLLGASAAAMRLRRKK